MNTNPSDIDYETAKRAYAGTSHVPERRARYVQREYAEFFRALQSEFEEYDGGDEMWRALEQFRTEWLAKKHELLAAKARCISAFVVGPAKFPTARARKAWEAADKKTAAFLDWNQKSLARLRREFDPVQAREYELSRPIRIGDDDAIIRLENKLAAANAAHEKMKQANRICRSKKSRDEKVAALRELGCDASLLTPDFAGRIGFASFQLTNSRARIRRMEKRLQAAIAEQETRAGGNQESQAGDDVTIIENVEIDRLQIAFPKKPPEGVRDWLKSNGFRWAPSRKVWQRQLTPNAREAARRFQSFYENL